MHFIIQSCGRRTLFILVSVSALALVLDLLSMVLIFPFLQIFVSPDMIDSNYYVNISYRLSGLGTHAHFIIAVGLGLMVVYIGKLALRTVLNHVRYDKSGQVTFQLTSDLFDGLLRARYGLFASESTSEMVGIITAHTIRSLICLEAWITILNEVAFFLVMIAVFLVIGPLVTLSILGVFLIIALLLYFGLVKRIAGYGKVHSRLNLLVYRFAFAVASTIKDIKIMGLEPRYSDRFTSLWKEYSENDAKTKTMKAIPKDFAETLVFAAIIVVCLFVLILHGNLMELIPVLGLIGVSATRFLPSFTKIINSYNEYKYYRGSLSVVEELARKLSANRQETEHEDLPFQSSLKIESLLFQYDDKIILNNISLEIQKGSSVAFVGESGAGKSTLLDILAGLQEAQNGNFFLDGNRFDPFRSDALRSRIGYVPQNVTLVDASVAYNISFDEDYDRERMQRVVEMARLSAFVEELPEGVDTIIGENGIRISGGQRQRIGIARALYREPEILVFDEATSALDNKTERDLMEEINILARSKTLIIVAHRLTTVEKCETIYLLDGGRIVARGSHADLLAASEAYQNLHRGNGSSG